MSKKPLFELTEFLIKKYCDGKTFSKGEDYIDSVSTLTLRGDKLSAKVQGSEPYHVNISLNEKNWKNGHCSCPAEFHPCKHIIAILLKIVREGIDSIEPAFEQTLQSLDADSLRAILINLVEQNPDLVDDIQLDLLKPQEKNDGNTPLINFSGLKRKLINILNSEFNHWDNSFESIIDDIKEIFNFVQPFLTAGDGKNSLKVLEAITEPMLSESSEFIDYAQDSYDDLLDELELLWIEAILNVEFSKNEKEYWFKRIFEWQSESELFLTALQLVQHGWSYPLLDAASKCEDTIPTAKNDDEKEEEIKDKIAPIALKILKRKQQWDQCLALAKLASMDQEYAGILIQQKRFQESLEFIKRTIKSPQTILQLARQFYDLQQSHIAYELSKNAFSYISDCRNVNQELINWVRELAFELNQSEFGIHIGTKILQSKPTLENYESLKRGSKEKWKNIRPGLIQMIQTSSKYSLGGPIEILLHEKLFDSAIKLSEQADMSFFPKFILDRVLEERSDWAMKKCEELAIAAINTSTSYGYKEAVDLLDKGYVAAKFSNKTTLWNEKIKQMIELNKRKRNLIPLLQNLLSIRS